MRKRTFKALAGALVAVALVVAPLVTAGASAAEPSASWPADTVGVKGELKAWTSDTNHTDYWKQQYPDAIACYSSEASTDHGRITDGGKTVTLNEYSPSWPGDHWEVLVIKAGNDWNSVIENPQAGVAYASPPNSAGNQANVSHWIVCKGKTPEQPKDKVTVDKESTTDCVKNVVVTVTTTTTTPYIWDAATQKWVLDSANAESSEKSESRPLTEEEWADCNPTTTKTTYGEWADGEWDCGDTSVTQTREVYTTVYHGEIAEPTVTTTETQERELTPEEISANCDLIAGVIESVCIGDAPFLGYEVTLPEGFETEDENPVTITFVNPEGEDYVVPGTHPLSGTILWPGASTGTPKMWPGWELVNGEYVKTDGNYDWTRNGVTVRFQVNPSYETEVEYPAASEDCANPPVGGGDDPTGTPASTDSGALAATGGGISPMFAVAGGAALFAGISVVAIAAYRRRKAGAE
ncbi:hypothetical protein MRBLWH7_002098 [Microbacterium sp. LWH7-1.2]|uniref:hypothetical protein n=1 Tax=Microbacterium sp. LWH7-1.2 TaxID=3135257 RepID=UPI003139FDDC